MQNLCYNILLWHKRGGPEAGVIGVACVVSQDVVMIVGNKMFFIVNGNSIASSRGNALHQQLSVMYKDDNVIIPEYRFDKYPNQGKHNIGVLPLDEVDEYLDDGTLHSCIVDLPFLVTKREWTENCKMHQRFNSFNDMDEATEVNKYMLKLSYEKLKKNGQTMEYLLSLS
jgi:hypothetical protein